MIDIRKIRENPELYRKNCERRGADVDIGGILEKDAELRELIQCSEKLRADRNRLSKECRDNPEAREKVKLIKSELSGIESKLEPIRESLDRNLALMPNLLAPEVPDGSGDEDNREIRRWGEMPEFDFEPKDHQELAEKLDIIDTARGAKVAQSGFYYWKGKGARLCSALFFWAQNELAKKGFTQFMTPCLARQETLYGTGYLPFFADQTYSLEKEDLSLIGTSEQVLVGYHADEIIESADLPLRYSAFTPCFRTEAGSYGKETRGIYRVHQFHKVEQIVFCLPGESEKQQDFCQENEEDLARSLGIPYRVVDVCVGDLGAPGYRKYDIEGWFPGYGGYRELTSNTNLTDFQARRLKIRFKDEDGKKDFVHTISATAVTDRWAIAILELFQNKDGSVDVPEALRQYTGFDKIEV